MSVTYLTPDARSASRRAKMRAVPVAVRLDRMADDGPRVTAGRPGPVGRTTIATSIERSAPLVAEAMATGLEAVRLLERRADETARAFRWGRTDDGRRGLAALIQGTHALVQLISAAVEEMGRDLDEWCESAGLDAARDTRRAVMSLVAAQMGGDRHAIAGTIERRFAPALAAWRSVLDAFGGAPDDPSPYGHAA
jgi:hypothetical protein